MSREALSLDISRVVSRVVSGEPIDTAENGAALAAKYPDLGMSATLISQAIERAAGMVGMIKSAPEPVKPRPELTIAAPKSAAITNKGNGHAPARIEVAAVAARTVEAPKAAPPALPAAPASSSVLSIEDDLAAAIDAEIGNLVSGQKAKAVSQPASDERASKVDAGPAPLAIVAATAAIKTFAEVAANEAARPDAAPSPAADAAVNNPDPKSQEPERGSIFSNFRRALFRT